MSIAIPPETPELLWAPQKKLSAASTTYGLSIDILLQAPVVSGEATV